MLIISRKCPHAAESRLVREIRGHKHRISHAFAHAVIRLIRSFDAALVIGDLLQEARLEVTIVLRDLRSRYICKRRATLPRRGVPRFGGFQMRWGGIRSDENGAGNHSHDKTAAPAGMKAVAAVCRDPEMDGRPSYDEKSKIPSYNHVTLWNSTMYLIVTLTLCTYSCFFFLANSKSYYYFLFFWEGGRLD